MRGMLERRRPGQRIGRKRGWREAQCRETGSEERLVVVRCIVCMLCRGRNCERLFGCQVAGPGDSLPNLEISLCEIQSLKLPVGYFVTRRVMHGVGITPGSSESGCPLSLHFRASRDALFW